LLGRVAGDDLERAAVLQQLGEPLVDELARVVAERLAALVLQLAARPPFLPAEQPQQPLRHLVPGGVAGVEVAGEDAVPREADADHLTGEHGDAAPPPALLTVSSQCIYVYSLRNASTSSRPHPMEQTRDSLAQGRILPFERAGHENAASPSGRPGREV